MYENNLINKNTIKSFILFSLDIIMHQYVIHCIPAIVNPILYHYICNKYFNCSIVDSYLVLFVARY